MKKAAEAYAKGELLCESIPEIKVAMQRIIKNLKSVRGAIMKEIVVISGKGGTGKTSITAAFAMLAGKNVVIADCDVDAADMHLLLEPYFAHSEDFLFRLQGKDRSITLHEMRKMQTGV